MEYKKQYKRVLDRLRYYNKKTMGLYDKEISEIKNVAKEYRKSLKKLEKGILSKSAQKRQFENPFKEKLKEFDVYYRASNKTFQKEREIKINVYLSRLAHMKGNNENPKDIYDMASNLLKIDDIYSYLFSQAEEYEGYEAKEDYINDQLNDLRILAQEKLDNGEISFTDYASAFRLLGGGY